MVVPAITGAGGEDGDVFGAINGMESKGKWLMGIEEGADLKGNLTLLAKEYDCQHIKEYHVSSL